MQKRHFRKYKRRCKRCGKVVMVKWYKRVSFKFCSRKCQQLNQRKRVWLTCVICKKKIELPFYRKKEFKACSKKCCIEYHKIWYAKHKEEMRRKLRGHPAWNKGLHCRFSPKSEFKKGMIPWNKNKHYDGVSPETEFKHEPRPHKRIKIKGIRIRHSKGRKLSVIKIKHSEWIKNKGWQFIRLGRFEITARYVWKKCFGIIPKGNVIYHRDGNSLNNDPSNLDCITRKELLYRNDPKKSRR